MTLQREGLTVASSEYAHICSAVRMRGEFSDGSEDGCSGRRRDNAALAPGEIGASGLEYGHPPPCVGMCLLTPLAVEATTVPLMRTTVPSVTQSLGARPARVCGEARCWKQAREGWRPHNVLCLTQHREVRRAGPTAIKKEPLGPS